MTMRPISEELIAPPASGTASPTRAGRVFSLIERALLVSGIVLFVVVLRRLGAASVGGHLAAVGWGFVAILGQEIFAAIANALGWWFAFSKPRPAVPFTRLLAARIVGDGVNAITPTATLGGEVVRARLLGQCAEAARIWASVAVAKISQTVAQVAFILCGFLLVSDQMPLPPVMRRGLWVCVPAFASLIVMTVWLQRLGLFTVAARLGRRLGLCIPLRVDEMAHSLDAEIRRIYAERGSFVLSTACFFVGWTIGVFEIFLILHFLGVGASWQRALTVETLAITVDALLFFVPAKAGTQEGGKALIFSLLALDPAKGFALGIIRRMRELTWAAIGLIILSRRQWRNRA